MGAFKHIPGLWLDVTRLLTRVGRGALTGIDRVELAYLKEAYATGCESYLCRTTRGYLRLDRRGALKLIEMSEGTLPLGPADWLSRVTFRGDRARHRAEAMLRQVAVDRCGRKALLALIERASTPNLTYINVGHANLSEATLSAFSAKNARVMVMIHDLIPLTHPQFVVANQPANFAGRVERVCRYATHVIANSCATDADLIAHWASEAQTPLCVVARLGIEPRFLSEQLDREPGYFVMLGTVEVRKNHELMIDVWDLLAAELCAEDMPVLHIIGPIGWKVDALLSRLQAHPLIGDRIVLHGALTDDQVQDHLARATALLFPSLAEGYGFPPLEAAMAGVVPVCSTLPVFQETLGDCAVYVDSGDSYQWKETIKQLLDGTSNTPDLTKLKVPTWQEHFEIVTDAIIPEVDWGRP